MDNNLELIEFKQSRKESRVFGLFYFLILGLVIVFGSCQHQSTEPDLEIETGENVYQTVSSFYFHEEGAAYTKEELIEKHTEYVKQQLVQMLRGAIEVKMVSDSLERRHFFLSEVKIINIK
ncbi:MAG: hypothetical protein K9I99_03785 [Melioribacteraceae bacterium]|nr:hypothetical protein [Melioribacteraceae bacterium]